MVSLRDSMMHILQAEKNGEANRGMPVVGYPLAMTHICFSEKWFTWDTNSKSWFSTIFSMGFTWFAGGYPTSDDTSSNILEEFSNLLKICCLGRSGLTSCKLQTRVLMSQLTTSQSSCQSGPFTYHVQTIYEPFANYSPTILKTFCQPFIRHSAIIWQPLTEPIIYRYG